MNGTGLSIFLFFIGNPITVFVFPLWRPLFLTLRGIRRHQQGMGCLLKPLKLLIHCLELEQLVQTWFLLTRTLVLLAHNLVPLAHHTGSVGSGMKAVAPGMSTTSMTLSSVTSPFTTSTTSIWLLIKDNYSQRGKHQFGCYQR